MTDSFLPTGYEIPTSETGYMKFEKGPNKFRILTKPLLGYIAWIDKAYTEDGKPKPERFKMDAQMIQKKEWSQNPKHFWAFVVWNYKAERFQILDVTQISIQREIDSLYRNEDWGEPFGYDITVTKTGDNMETKYSVQPSPHKELKPEIKDAFSKLSINLDALWDNEDPFEEVKPKEELDYAASETKPSDLPF